MPALMKKPRTETIELKFTGPVSNSEQAITAMKAIGFVDASDSVPWRDAYPECSEAQLIGKALDGARYREDLTQTQLAKLVGIPQRHIPEMENGKRPIGKKMAKRLGKVLNMGYKVFL